MCHKLVVGGEAKRAYFKVIAKERLDFVMAWSDPD